MPGQVVFVFAVLRFGEAIEEWTAPIVAYVTAHLVETTVVVAFLVVVQQLWSRWRKRNRKDDDPPSLPI